MEQDGIDFVVRGDNSAMLDAMRQTERAINQTAQSAVEAGRVIDKAMQQTAQQAEGAGNSLDIVANRMREAMQAASEGVEQAGDSIYSTVAKVGTAMSGDLAGELAKNLDDAAERVTDFGQRFNEASQESISSLSQWSASLGEKANDIKAETTLLFSQVEQAMVEATNTGDNGALESLFDKIEANIKQYSDTLMESAASAQAAYNVQAEAVAALARQLEDLRDLQQRAANSGLQDEADDLRDKIAQVSLSLDDAKEHLSQLGEQADTTNEKLSQIGELSQQYNQVAASGAWGNLGAQISELGAKVGEATQSFANWATGNGKFQASLDGVKTALGSIGSMFGPAIAGAKQLLMAMRAMVATPLGAILTAVVLVLQAVHKWFTKSADGQRAFAKISAFLGSIMESLMDIIVKLGGYLYHCFADAQGPLHNYAVALVNTLGNAIKSVYHLIKGLTDAIGGMWDMLKGEEGGWERVKNAGKMLMVGSAEMGKAVAGMALTLKEGLSGVGQIMSDAWNNFDVGALGAFGTDMLARAKESSRLAGEQIEQEIALQNAQQRQAEIEKEIGEQYEKVYTLQGKEKQEAIARLKLLQREKYDGILAAQKKMYEIKRDTNALHTSSLEDLRVERDLRTRMLQTEAQRASATRMLARLEASTARSMQQQEKSAAKQAAAADKRAATAAKKNAEQKRKESEAEAAELELIHKNTIERVKAVNEMEERVTDARIAAMQEGSAKVQAERERELQKELMQITSDMEQAVEAERQRQMAEYEANRKVLIAQGKDAPVWSEEMLDNAEVEKIKKQYEELGKLTQHRFLQGQREIERQAMLDYLKDYGTLQQQRLAIAEDYAKKIAQAQTEGEKQKLSRERENALAALDAKRLAASVDWGATFEGVGNVLSDIAKETLKQVNDYMKTAEFKGLSADQKKAWVDLRNRLTAETGGDTANPLSPSTWGNIANLTKTYQQSVRDLLDAQERERVASEKLARLKEQEAKATNPTVKAALQGAIAVAQKEFDQASADVQSRQGEKDVAQSNLTDATSKAVNGLNNMTKIMGELNSGSLSGFVDGVTKAITSIAGEAKSLQQLGKAGGIVGAILSLLDAMGDAPAEFVEGLFDKISEALFNALSQLPNMLVGVVKGIGGIFTSIFSGIGSWFTSSNSRWVKEYTEELTKANDGLIKSLDGLRESIDKSAGGKAIADYQKAITAQERLEKNLNAILQAQMSEYGRHHSNASYFNLSSRDYAEITAIVGKRVASLTDIYSLSAKELNMVRTYASDIWARILDQGKYDKSEYWENYVEQAEALDELTEQINQNLTQTSFDNLRSGFLDTLMDMESDASAWSGNFAEMMQRSLLNYALGDFFDNELKTWYEGWAEIMREQQGQLTKQQLEQYREEWDDFRRRGVEKRDSIAELTGYTGTSSEGSGSFKGASSLTEATGTAIEGRLTAMQIQGETRNNLLAQSLASMQGLSVVAAQNSGTMAEMRNILLQSNSYLEDIARYTKTTTSFGDKLDRLVTNTDRL